MMKSTASIAIPVSYRHSGTPRKSTTTEEKSDAEIRADVRAWEVKCLLEEMQVFGLEPPLGLKARSGFSSKGAPRSNSSRCT
jgi:hypothetical protein